MPRSGSPPILLAAALSSAIAVSPAAAIAGSELITADAGLSQHLGIWLRQFCVDTFPRFSKAASAIDSRPDFERRVGQKVWDHKGLAVTMSLPRINGRPACVMTAISKNWQGDAWAAFAVPVFGATWDSDQTIVSKGETHKGDNWEQHIVVRFPTYQQFAFDADRRADGLWTYTISLIAAK